MANITCTSPNGKARLMLTNIQGLASGVRIGVGNPIITRFGGDIDEQRVVVIPILVSQPTTVPSATRTPMTTSSLAFTVSDDSFAVTRRCPTYGYYRHNGRATIEHLVNAAVTPNAVDAAHKFGVVGNMIIGPAVSGVIGIPSCIVLGPVCPSLLGVRWEHGATPANSFGCCLRNAAGAPLFRMSAVSGGRMEAVAMWDQGSRPPVFFGFDPLLQRTTWEAMSGSTLSLNFYQSAPAATRLMGHVGVGWGWTLEKYLVNVCAPSTYNGLGKFVATNIPMYVVTSTGPGMFPAISYMVHHTIIQ